jgi:hypothetical protein
MPYSTVIDLVGLSFGRLKVVERAPNKGKHACWVCDCSCGTQGIIVLGGNLRRGNTQSCGCLHKERTGQAHYKHGMVNTSEYAIWSSMRQRCLDPNSPAYNRYGGRGITICDTWEDSFEAFYTDMGPRPSATHSLERINNDLGYSKENCRWATPSEQSRNTRRNHLLTYNGKTQCVTDWAEEMHLSSAAIFLRLRRGWDIEKTLTTPLKPPDKREYHTWLTYNDKTQCLAAWAKEFAIDQVTLSMRLQRGWTLNRALTTPVNIKHRRKSHP